MGRHKHAMISQYRQRLEQTLVSHDLLNDKSLAALVKKQLLYSPQHGFTENVLDTRVLQLSNFLEMLRSVSSDGNESLAAHSKQQSEWKLKQDTEDCRVMYREGPQGTPFHMLLVEGFVDAPVDVCLCVSWESALYNKWWPQSSIPTFKILSCRCLQKIQIGEQISSVRMKLSWPLSDREGLVHYFVFEYLQGDLIIVLVNSVSGLDAVGGISGESNNNGIAEEDDMVRIDIVGGFAIQKVTPERSYFRTIMSMDIKLEFVPPSVINFISRQLVGTGFKLYKKTVASVSKGDGDFRLALGDPLYSQIRKALYSNSTPKRMLEQEDQKNNATLVLPKECVIDTVPADKVTDHEVVADNSGGESQPASLPIKKALGEIEKQELDDSRILPEELLGKTIMKECEEEEEEEIRVIEEISKEINDNSTKQIEEKQCVNHVRNVFVRPAVKEALKTLENAISFVQNGGLKAQTMLSAKHLELPSVQSTKGYTKFSDVCCSNSETCIEVSNDGHPNEGPSDEPTNSPQNFLPRYTCTDSSTRDVKHYRIAPTPAPPEQSLPVSSESLTGSLDSFGCMEAKAPIIKEAVETEKQLGAEANGVHENSVDVKIKLKMQSRLCCLPLMPKRLKA